MNYGCGIWAPHIIAKKKSVPKGIDGKAEVWHRSVLQQTVGVRKSVSMAILMHDMGRQPFCFALLKQCIMLWNEICARKNDDLVKLATKELYTITVVDM
jgi:hypothetical protein